MALRTDDLQSSGFPRIIIQLDICTTARHVGSNGHRSVYTCISYDFRFLLMILGIEHVMLDSLSLEHSAQELRYFDRDRTDEHRLSFGMCPLYFLYYCFIFFFLCLIYSIFKVDTLYRFIRRDLDNVHSIDIPELFLLSERCTGHTTLLVKFIKQVLESDRSQSLALPADFHMFLCLNCLMETV